MRFRFILGHYEVHTADLFLSNRLLAQEPLFIVLSISLTSLLFLMTPNEVQSLHCFLWWQAEPQNAVTANLRLVSPRLLL